MRRNGGDDHCPGTGKYVNNYVKDTPALNPFFKDNKEFIQNIAKKTVGLANADHGPG